MMSQPKKQTIAIHILPNISQRRGNQTMKLGQLMWPTWLKFSKYDTYHFDDKNLNLVLNIDAQV